MKVRRHFWGFSVEDELGTLASRPNLQFPARDLYPDLPSHAVATIGYYDLIPQAQTGPRRRLIHMNIPKNWGFVGIPPIVWRPEEFEEG